MGLESYFSKNKNPAALWAMEAKIGAIVFAIGGTVISGAYAAGLGFMSYGAWQNAHTKLDCIDAGILTYATGIMSLVSVAGSYSIWRDAINELKT
jgi:hypothetical protein